MVDHVDYDVGNVIWTGVWEMHSDMRDIQQQVHEDKDAYGLRDLVPPVNSLRLCYE